MKTPSRRVPKCYATRLVFVAADTFFALAFLFETVFFAAPALLEVIVSLPTPKCPRYRLKDDADTFLAGLADFFAETDRAIFTPRTALRAALRLSVSDDEGRVDMVGKVRRGCGLANSRPSAAFPPQFTRRAAPPVFQVESEVLVKKEVAVPTIALLKGLHCMDL